MSRQPHPMVETQRVLRGHEFLPPARARAQIPGCYGQDHIPPADKTIHAHYFGGPYDLWVTEMWQEDDEPGQWRAFGYVRFVHMPENAEWGYQSLNELEQLRATGPDGTPVIIERDVAWQPKPMWACDGSGIFDDFGYDYIVAWGNVHGWAQAVIAGECRRAAATDAPEGAVFRHGGTWVTVDTAPPKWRAYFGLPPSPTTPEQTEFWNAHNPPCD